MKVLANGLSGAPEKKWERLIINSNLVEMTLTGFVVASVKNRTSTIAVGGTNIKIKKTIIARLHPIPKINSLKPHDFILFLK